MELSRINDEMIRVELSKEEQAIYGISAENIRKSDILTRKLCEKILLRATEEKLFIRTSDTVTIKAKQTENGLTLWIENTESDKDSEYLCQIVRFRSASDLLDALPLFVVHNKDYIYSTLYSFNGSYYLYFEIFTSHEKALKLLKNLLEYGQRTSVPRCYLSEHAETICRDNALNELLTTVKR